jgi:hypothetical protein
VTVTASPTSSSERLSGVRGARDVWRDVRFPLLAFAALVVFVWADARLSMDLISFHAGVQDFHVPWVLDTYVRYDSGWYHSIATKGYFYAGPDQQSSVAFFPAYPLAMRVGAVAVRDEVVSGVLVSLACGTAIAVLFHRWARPVVGERSARFGLALLLVYPFAFYLGGVVYSDGLFLVAVLVSFACLEKDRPVLAGLAAAVATGARPVGVAMCVALVLRLLERRGVLSSRRAPWRVEWAALRNLRWPDAGVLLSPLGLVAFMALLWVRFDDPMVWTKVGGASGWWRGVGIDVVAKVHLFRLLESYGLNLVTFWLLVQGAFSLLAFGALPAIVRRFGWGYAAYVLGVVGIAFATTRDFIGMGRYVLVAFPVFAALGDSILGWSGGAMSGLRRWLPAVVLAVSAGLLAWQVSLFARWYFLA